MNYRSNPSIFGDVSLIDILDDLARTCLLEEPLPVPVRVERVAIAEREADRRFLARQRRV